MHVQNRSIAMVILLTIVTCGIYGWVWYYQTTTEVNMSLGENDNALFELLLIFITCGLYGFYWFYKYNQRLVRLGQTMGLTLSDNALIYILLCVFGLGIVSIGIMQNQLNEVADKKIS